MRVDPHPGGDERPDLGSGRIPIAVSVKLEKVRPYIAERSINNLRCQTASRLMMS